MRRCVLVIVLALLFTSAQPAPAQFIPQVLGDNPAGFWLLNDLPGTPATAVDSSVNGFNGTYGPGVTARGIAGPSWVPSPGLVANFSGGTVSFASPLNLGGSGYTIEAWINPTLFSLANRTRFVASGTGLSGYGFGTDAGGRLIFTTYSLQDYITAQSTLQPNQWQYVGVVFDSNFDANFYVNGSLVQTVLGTLPTDVTLSNFTIGNKSPGPGNDEFYMGGLAGVSVYNTALTGSQIQAQYTAAAPEPSSLILTGLAALGAGRVWWQRRRKASSPIPPSQESGDTSV